MSMLDLVRRAFAEGGSQLEALSGLLECKDLGPGLTTEEKVELALAEVLQLKSQLQTLQQQMSALMQDRERMNLLIWAELSRLSLKIEGGIALRSPVRSALLEDVSIKSDPILKAILSASSGCSLMNEPVAEEGEEVQSGGTPKAVVCLRGTKRHRVSSSVVACEEDGVQLRSSLSSICGRSPPSGCSMSTGETASCGEEAEGGRREVPSEQKVLIDTWIKKQRSGFESASEGGSGIQNPWSLIPGEVWHCYVCNSESREPPGDHFCVGKYEQGQREGLKVFCQYCRKGTARMPDLRVHFKKIVYCRVLREELKKHITIKTEEDHSIEENRSAGSSAEERSADEPNSDQAATFHTGTNRP